MPRPGGLSSLCSGLLLTRLAGDRQGSEALGPASWKPKGHGSGGPRHTGLAGTGEPGPRALCSLGARGEGVGVTPTMPEHQPGPETLLHSGTSQTKVRYVVFDRSAKK